MIASPRHIFAALLCLSVTAAAQGTRQWTVSRPEEFERGTPKDLAIRNDGHLEPAPALKPIATSESSYLWCIAAAPGNTTVAGTGAASGGSHLLRMDAAGKVTNLADFKELNVQAVAVLPDGAILAATSPDGKVYRVATGGKPEVLFDPAATPEKPKYLWSLAVAADGNILAATGAPAAIYRISPHPGTPPQLLFRSGDQHIRTLLLDPQGTIYAGSDGAGIIYRIQPNGTAFALYAAPKHEITSLALDPAGNLYAAAAGDRKPPALPPLPAVAEPRVAAQAVVAQPITGALAPAASLVPDGSEIYRIAPDGTPLRLAQIRDEIVYALAFRNGALIAGTGNRGRIYRIDPAIPARAADIAHVDANQAVSFAGTPSTLRIATANSGKLAELSDAPAADATYISEVFDAEITALWGRAEIVGSTTGIEFFARSGNIENPHSTQATSGNKRTGFNAEDLWSPWQRVMPGQTPLPVPATRYLQWKAVLHPGAELTSVTINYLQRNLPPLVEDVVVQPGARVSPTTTALPATAVAINFRSATTATPPDTSGGTPAPLIAQRDRTAVTARWIARDPNGDDLLFAVYVRGLHESAWRLLKDRLTERAWSFDAALLPDGEYELRVVASDAPAHPANEALTAERVSAPFTLDTTPPIPGLLTATLRDGHLRATVEAHDATSPISHAEFSIDAGPWMYLEPDGKLSDSFTEHYSIDQAVTSPGEHTVAVRIFDRFENAVTVKALAQ